MFPRKSRAFSSNVEKRYRIGDGTQKLYLGVVTNHSQIKMLRIEFDKSLISHPR